MDKEMEERITKIGKSLGYGGKTFTTEDVMKVNEFMIMAEINSALCQLILDEKVQVTIVDGEPLFQAI